MAICAQDCKMSARQRKTRLFVANQRKARGLEALQAMTRFAAILVRRSGKLAFVNILVTVPAFCACDFEYRVRTLCALGYMALVASNGNMAAFQWVFCSRMIFDGKRRWLETFDRVAAGTFSAVCTGLELAFVRILVAVSALREWRWCFEISVCVAVSTSHRRVLAKQRIFCL